jgi:rhamnose utilization protein RhaD (predicted bifunctional aldolase and dehydrogenase)
MNQHPRIVTEEALEKALDYLRDSARDLGDAKARLVKAGHMLKHVEAIEYKKSDAKTAEAKKADARTSETFMSAIVEDAEAAGAYEMMKALREAAALKIEAWRSEQANYRSMRI